MRGELCTYRPCQPAEIHDAAGSPLELDAAPAVVAAHALDTPLVGGTVLKAPLPGTVLPNGGALPGAATVFTQNQLGRTKASQQRTIVVTVAGMTDLQQPILTPVVL